MNKFKVGDKVIRTGNNFNKVIQGKCYKIIYSNGRNLQLEGIIGVFDAGKFKLKNKQIYVGKKYECSRNDRTSPDEGETCQLS